MDCQMETALRNVSIVQSILFIDEATLNPIHVHDFSLIVVSVLESKV